MKLAIFDLDDTLIDFAATRELAYRRLAGRLDSDGVDSAAFLRACAIGDRPLFALFEQGAISRNDYRLRRFREPLQGMGLTPGDDLVAELNQLFMDCVNDSPLVYADVVPVLQKLRMQGLGTAILTNGPSDGQRRKLEVTGLGGLVDHVAIGEETGFSKPSPAAFHGVVAHFGCEHGDALMVGDSPELDYDAALSAGLRALLLDRESRHQGSGRAFVTSLNGVLLP